MVPAESSESHLAEEIQNVIQVGAVDPGRSKSHAEILRQVGETLSISREKAGFLVSETQRLYVDRMTQRFSSLRVADRLKRTNPFLLRIRGARTAEDWAALQVQSALYASEEEAVGHLLEAIAKICFPGATEPLHPDDFDLEVRSPDGRIDGYQIKMSWDCMPMSSRKNLSNTIRSLKAQYSQSDVSFVGYFAPCYGRAHTSQAAGQDYVSLASREFWTRVGDGDTNFDVKVGEVCALLCSEFRLEILNSMVPDLVQRLADAVGEQIGDGDGRIDYTTLFRRVNR